MTDPAKLVGSDRVLAVLLELAEHPSGISLDELAKRMGSTKPTLHRALASLRRAGLANQSSRGVYELGDEFMRLAFRHQDARPETVGIEPLLGELASEYGETAHYAILDRPQIVYRAKADPPSGAMRLTSTIGGRNPAYSTAVGKLLMSAEVSTRRELDAWLGPAPLPQRTEYTITDRDALLGELERTRVRGYGTDNQENELGVNCVALPVFLGGGRLGAVSVSGLSYRRDLDSLATAVPAIRAAIERHLGAGSSGPVR
ncbi:MAG: transcriptional regulator, IclR family [Rhodoglobus sp.]|nr:transcriptional regulator, IclR family [Rhodoglobus sp.]